MLKCVKWSKKKISKFYVFQNYFWFLRCNYVSHNEISSSGQHGFESWQAGERINYFLSMNQYMMNIQHIKSMNEHQLKSFYINTYSLEDSNDDQFFLYTLSMILLYETSSKVFIWLNPSKNSSKIKSFLLSRSTLDYSYEQCFNSSIRGISWC